MITLELKEASPEISGDLPRDLRGISGCSYQFLSTPDWKKSLDVRESYKGVGPVLSSYYEQHRAEYDSLPKTKEDAAKLGLKGFDGLQVSVEGDRIAPIRYSYLLAYQKARSELIKQEDFRGVAALEEENPLILAASVYAVTRHKGEPCIMMQIKGNTVVGEDEVHSALASGGISMKEFKNSFSIKEMLWASAVRQASEELGLMISQKNLKEAALIRRENATGNMGVGYILSGFSGSDILDAFAEHATSRLIASSDDTAKGIALMPTRGIVTISLKDGVPELHSRAEMIVTQDGARIVTPDSPRKMRPACQGFLAALADPKFLRELLERSGL